MLNKSTRSSSKVPPHIAIIGVLVAVVGAAAAALLFSRAEPKAEALIVPRAARVERVDGNVGVTRAVETGADAVWDDAELNTPLAVGDRIYADSDSRAAIAFTGRNRARVNPNSSLDVLSLADRRTQLALRSGSAIFDIGDLAPGELFEVATPGGAVDFYEPGLYQIGVGDDGNTMISVLSGIAEVVGLAGSGQLSKGDVLTLIGQTAVQAVLSKVSPDLAGGILDDYFGDRYPHTYDGRYEDYNAYLNDPYYYDPYRRSESYRHLPAEIAGCNDLDYYGDWVEVDNYGRVWSPRVADNWAPYRNGYWEADNVWGPTWVAEEPWGWAPYHYGRWAQVNNRWVWVPQEAVARPVYAPALVAFVPVAQTNQIAWVPLAPGEAYVQRYYDAGFNPQYLAPTQAITEVVNVRQTYVNMHVPSAITAVPVERFTSYIEPGVIAQVNPQLIAQAQPVLDPFAVQNLREAVMRREGGRHKFKAHKMIEQQVLNTPVVTSVAPVILPARTGLAQAYQSEAVTEKQRKRKMRFEQSGQVLADRRADGLPQPPIPQSHASDVAGQRGQQVAAEAIQRAQQDRAARKEQRRAERAAREQGSREQGSNAGQVVLPEQQVKQQRKEQRRAERAQQQPAINQQQQPIEAARRAERKQRKQQEWLRAQQQSASQADAGRAERKAQKRAERQQVVIQQQRHSAAQQAAQQPAAQSAQQQQREQRKAQRRAGRQQQVMNQQPVYRQPVHQQPQAVPSVNRQQRKMERRAERAAQQPVVIQQQQQQVATQQAQQVRQQRKEQRRAERAAQQVYSAPAQSSQPAQSQQSGKAQRKAEKRAARNNQ